MSILFIAVLIEWLVVIAVVAILAGRLLPTLGGSKESAKRALRINRVFSN